MTRMEVFNRIHDERAYQQKRWHDKPQSVGAFITLLDFYVSEAKRAWAKNPDDEQALHQIRKVAAIAVATGEQHGFPFRALEDFER